MIFHESADFQSVDSFCQNQVFLCQSEYKAKLCDKVMMYTGYI